MLKRAAEKLGGTQELGRYLQVPEVRIRVWMRGRISPPDDVFLRLVDLLEPPPGQLSSRPTPEGKPSR